eukprot:3941873-Rhodomonas_salina.2
MGNVKRLIPSPSRKLASFSRPATQIASEFLRRDSTTTIPATTAVTVPTTSNAAKSIFGVEGGEVQGSSNPAQESGIVTPGPWTILEDALVGVWECSPSNSDSVLMHQVDCFGIHQFVMFKSNRDHSAHTGTHHSSPSVWQTGKLPANVSTTTSSSSSSSSMRGCA